MNYIWLIIFLIAFWVLTPICATYLTVLCPALFFIIGFVLTTFYPYMGIGASIGCLLSLLIAYKAIPRFWFFKKYESKGILASWCFIIATLCSLLNQYTVNYSLKTSNLLVLLITLVAIFITFYYIYMSSKRHEKFSANVEMFRKSVQHVKIVEKYPEQHKWAVYLYFDNGHEDWNYAVASSDHAMNPKKNDLTYVFDSKNEAVKYVKDFFSNASIIEA